MVIYEISISDQVARLMLDVDDPDSLAEIQFEGELIVSGQNLMDSIKFEFTRSWFGRHGHLFTTETTAADLPRAFGQLPTLGGLSYKLVEGQEIMDQIKIDPDVIY